MKCHVHIIHPCDIVRLGIENIIRSIPLVQVSSYLYFKDFTYQPNEKNLVIFDKDYLDEFNDITKRHNGKLILGICINTGNEIIGKSDIKCVKLDIGENELRELVKHELGLTGKSIGKVEQNSLSAREVDVVRCIAKGMSNKEIADVLCISTHTVITHRKNITAKLGIKSASGLTVFALLEGIISGEEVTNR
jgi:DNA-binding CsgD family transcriptional regulator